MYSYVREAFQNVWINLDEMLYGNKYAYKFLVGQIVKKQSAFLSNQILLSIRPCRRYLCLSSVPPFRLHYH